MPSPRHRSRARGQVRRAIWPALAGAALAGIGGGVVIAYLGAPPPPLPPPAPTELDRHTLHSLSPDEAAELARFPGTVDLSGLTTVSPEVAASLARHDGPLVLDGAWLIPDDAANALDQHAGPVALAALVARARSAETLSPALARLLVRQAALLALDRLTTLDSPVAEVLGRHRDGLHLPRRSPPAAPRSSPSTTARFFFPGLSPSTARRWLPG